MFIRLFVFSCLWFFNILDKEVHGSFGRNPEIIIGRKNKDLITSEGLYGYVTVIE